MKRVRYALGTTAALAPVAIGMAPVTVAHAATNVIADGSAKGKTVSLNHPSAPSAAPALSTCTASGETTEHVNSLIKSFIIWNIQKPGFICVGTTEVKRFFKNKNSVNIRFVVSYGKSHSLAASKSLPARTGLAGQTKTFQSAFREWFPIGSNEAGVDVCVSSTYTFPLACYSIKSGHTG